MASLKDIRRRIASVKNTQQITKAMKMVAASKLRRAQQAITGARPFAEKLEEITSRVLGEIASTVPGADAQSKLDQLKKLHPLLRDSSVGESEEPQKVGLVVVASDRGLCGAYNSAILKYALKKKQSLEQDPKVKVQLYFVGRRANDFFTKRGQPGHYFNQVWQGKFNTQKSDEMARYFVTEFLEGRLDRLEICYTEFKSAILQIPSQKVLLPLSINLNSLEQVPGKVTEDQTNQGVGFIYKPEREKLLEKLLPKQVQTQLYKCLADSLASEFGARMTSMDNATRNAAKMISGLTLQANRVRQAAITTELMEIIGGAEALKG